jgi:general secretion pathway protein G
LCFPPVGEKTRLAARNRLRRRPPPGVSSAKRTLNVCRPPNIIGNIDVAAVNRAKQDIRSIETALNLYRLDNLKYPSNEEGLRALVSNPGETTAPNWKPGGYLRQMPVDPWNNAYQYQYPGQRSEFDVFSYGADGQEGGEEVNADIGNWALEN